MTEPRMSTPISASEQAPSRAAIRCGVCKVDLKGRFVFIDDRAQQLFACPSEDLFGKSIIDCVDESSRATVTDLLARRNHYETTFEHSPLTLLSPTGEPTCVDAVVTLNFNAGNPVNFQFILTPPSGSPSPAGPDPHAARYREFADFVTSRDITTDWRGYLRQLRDFTAARQACAYIISDDRLEHRSSALESAGSESSLPTIDPPGPIHLNVAATGNLYDFTDDRSVQRAVELGAAASSELICRLDLDDNSAFLIRVIFTDDLDDRDARSAADRTRFALDLTRRLASPPPTPAAVREEESLQFAVGLLDGLHIGAVMTDSRGKLILYNPTLATLLALPEVDGDLADLAQHLGSPTRSPESILDFLQPDAPLSMSAATLLNLDLPCGTAGLLTRLPLSGSRDDLTSFIAVIPCAPGGDNSDLLHFCRAALQSLQTTFNSTTERVARLSRETNRPAADLTKALGSVNSSLQDISRRASDIGAILALPGQKHKAELTDFNLITHRIAQHFSRRHPHLPLHVHTEVMPKVTTVRAAVTLAFETLLKGIAETIDRAATTVHVSAQITDNGSCTVLVAFDGPKDDLPDSLATALCAVRLLLGDIGGNVTHSVANNRHAFTLTIPVQS